MIKLVMLYVVPMLIMLTIFSCIIYKDIKNRSRDLTYGTLVLVPAITLIPIVNIIAVIIAIAAGVAYLWDEYAEKPIFKNP